MTPTQPSQAVEAAERKEFDKLHMRGVGAPSFRVWSKWNEHEKRIAWEAWLARAELARPEVAAVGPTTSIGDMCAILERRKINASEYTDSTILYQVTFEQLRAIYDEGRAAQRVPVALPKEPVAYQVRVRPTWRKEGEGWTGWESCSAESYADYKKTPILHAWQYETRALYTAPPSTALAQPKDPAPVPSAQALAAGAFYPQVTGYTTPAPKQGDAKP